MTYVVAIFLFINVTTYGYMHSFSILLIMSLQVVNSTDCVQLFS